MSSNVIDVPGGGDGRGLAGYLAVPRAGRGPGLVLLGGSDNGNLRAHADLYAAEGYLTLGIAATKADDDLVAPIAQLRSRREHTGGVAAIGFGEAGATVLRAAADQQVDCAVCYSPSGIEQLIDLAPRITGPIVLHCAGNDPATSPDALSRLREALAGSARPRDREVRPDIGIFVYPGAGTGFADHGSPDFNRAAADLAHSRTIGLLRRVLGPRYDLEALWEAHTRYEFETRDVAATMATMVDEPYVNHVPTMTGGVGGRDLARFYAHHFIPKCPADFTIVPISRTVGADRIVDEMLATFTHDVEIDWMLPGVAPTGRRVEIAVVAIVGFRGDKLYHEHIYWDQASVLVQIGLLDPKGLPVAGVETARKLLDQSLPSNTLMQRWAESASARVVGGGASA
jgi:carboxymethylenebutenolidase